MLPRICNRQRKKKKHTSLCDVLESFNTCDEQKTCENMKLQMVEQTVLHVSLSQVS